MAGQVGHDEIPEQRILENKMTDWAEGIETRNYGIKNEFDAGMLSELMRVIVALVIVAGSLLFYSWVRSQIVNTGYESQRLFTEEASLLRIKKSLILEEETLRNPERIDALARNELKMAPLRPNQLLPQMQDVERGASNAIAMVDSEATDARKSTDIGDLDTVRHN
jgi:cell division protein FtsL